MKKGHASASVVSIMGLLQPFSRPPISKPFALRCRSACLNEMYGDHKVDVTLLPGTAEELKRLGYPVDILYKNKIEMRNLSLDAQKVKSTFSRQWKLVQARYDAKRKRLGKDRRGTAFEKIWDSTKHGDVSALEEDPDDQVYVYGWRLAFPESIRMLGHSTAELRAGAEPSVRMVVAHDMAHCVGSIMAGSALKDPNSNLLDLTTCMWNGESERRKTHCRNQTRFQINLDIELVSETNVFVSISFYSKRAVISTVISTVFMEVPLADSLENMLSRNRSH